MKIHDFIKRNLNIKKLLENDGEDTTKIYQEWFLLQCSYDHYLNAECPNLPVRDLLSSEKVAIRALAQRLKGKKGRFR